MRKALITGGSRGIGKAIAEKLCALGYEVIKPSHEQLDLDDEKSIQSFLHFYNDKTFDVIVNNAGINEINYVENITEEEISKMININLLAPLRLIQGIVPKMKKQKYGKIVNIGSIWSVVGKPGRTLYSITKHGIHGITKSLAIELAPYNILVNTVCPGYTMTELTKKNNSEEQLKEVCEEIPLGRLATPEEQAEIVAFLVSEKNSYITGQMITVDGGYSSK